MFEDAYSYKHYTPRQWQRAIDKLQERGYTMEQVEVIMRSKFTRWCRDKYSASDRGTAKMILDYIDAEPKATQDLLNEVPEKVFKPQTFDMHLDIPQGVDAEEFIKEALACTLNAFGADIDCGRSQFNLGATIEGWEGKIFGQGKKYGYVTFVTEGDEDFYRHY